MDAQSSNLRRLSAWLARTLALCSSSDDSGQDLVEYGLLASLISVFAVGAMTALGLAVSDLWDQSVSTLGGLLS